jgi:hypothetical protein
LSERTKIPARRFVGWLGISEGEFYEWPKRYGQVNEHNPHVPRDWRLEDWKKKAILDFHVQYPLEGYRRLASMMLDADVVAVGPSSVYHVLKAAGKRAPRGGAPSRKGEGIRAAPAAA